MGTFIFILCVIVVGIGVLVPKGKPEKIPVIAKGYGNHPQGQAKLESRFDLGGQRQNMRDNWTGIPSPMCPGFLDRTGTPENYQEDHAADVSAEMGRLSTMRTLTMNDIERETREQYNETPMPNQFDESTIRFDTQEIDNSVPIPVEPDSIFARKQ